MASPTGFTLKYNQLNPLGTPLLRTWFHSRCADYSPTAATVAKFTVAGGNILVHRLFGQIVTTLETTASNVSVTLVPTTGTSSTVASTVDATAAAAGDFLQVEGDGTAVIKGGATSTYFVTAGFPNPFVVRPGVINIVHAAAMTGTLHWDLFWEPLDENATVTSA